MLGQVSLIHVLDLHNVPSPTTVRAPQHRFNTLPLSSLGLPPVRRVWASPLASRLAGTLGRIAFVTYGPSVHLRLLSTPSRDDAVTFSYRLESAGLEGTCTPRIVYTLRRTRRSQATFDAALQSALAS
jgi:hypothetical protein